MILIVICFKIVRASWNETEQQWYFSVVDVVELSTICRQLNLESSDGKKYVTDCANTESLLRIIQSIPSPKAEPFKQWLAKVGYERMQEISNPELPATPLKFST